MTVTQGRGVERSRLRGWQAAFLAASAWSCLAPDSSLAAVAAAMPANLPKQQTAGRRVAGGGVSSGGGGNRGWQGGSGVSFAGAAGGGQRAADRGVSRREVSAARGRAAPVAASASAMVSPPEGSRGRVRSAGFSASAEIGTRLRERPAPERVGGGSEDAKDGGPSTGGSDGLVPLLPRGSQGEGRKQGGVRDRRVQSEDGEEGDGEQAQEQEEEETTAEEDGLYGDEEDGVGSAGLMALVVCFGLLFCVMEVAKCYFLLECRRRRRWHRWRRQRVQNSAPQIPIASSRVIATDVPFAGSKDGWVEIVIDGVSTRNSLPGDKDMPSAPGYAVAGASHALQEAIEHARRLSPHRSYSATIFPPRATTPERAETISPEMASTDVPSEMLPARSDSPRASPSPTGVTPSSPIRA